MVVLSEGHFSDDSVSCKAGKTSHLLRESSHDEDRFLLPAQSKLSHVLIWVKQI